MDRKFFFIVVFIFALCWTACSHAPTSREPAQDRAVADFSQNEEQAINLKMTGFNLPIKVYKNGVFRTDEKVDIILFFAPENSAVLSLKFSEILGDTQYRGVLVVLTDDASGSYAKKLAAKSVFDTFFVNLMRELLKQDVPSEIQSVILIGFDSGAAHLSLLSHSGSSYLVKKLGGIVLFDAQFPSSKSLDEVVQIASSAPSDLKIYMSATSQYYDFVKQLEDKLENRTAAIAAEEIKNSSLSGVDLVSACLPKFLAFLSPQERRPFISFSCGQ